jgi:hypothetical protein
VAQRFYDRAQARWITRWIFTSWLRRNAPLSTVWLRSNAPLCYAATLPFLASHHLILYYFL